MSNTKKEKYSLLAELIRLANADNDFKEVEHQFIWIIAEQLGLTYEDYKILLVSTEDYPRPKPFGERVLQFQRLWLLMNSDEAIDEKETIALKTAAIQLGLSPEATNEIIRIAPNFPNKLVPNDLFISIFSKQFN
jgi:uncharacterized tellurite resistance protein B-like protein